MLDKHCNTGCHPGECLIHRILWFIFTGYIFSWCLLIQTHARFIYAYSCLIRRMKGVCHSCGILHFTLHSWGLSCYSSLGSLATSERMYVWPALPRGLCMWFCWNRKTVHVLEFSEVTIVPFSLFHAAAVAVCVRWWGGNPCMLVLWLLLAFRITFILCVHFPGSVLQGPFSVLLTSIGCLAEDAVSVL